MKPATPTCLLALALASATGPAAPAPVGTDFTYQGELRVAGVPASTPHDFEFVLYDVATGGPAISTLARGDVAVNGGLFTVFLDYTDVPFAASQGYWLEVRVRDGASTGSYTTLLPRQAITPAPYAVNARSVAAGGVNQVALAANAVTGAKILDGSIGPADLASGSVAASNLADNAVQSSSILDTSIAGVDIASGTIGTAHLANGAVTGEKIGASAVGTNQLGDGTVAGVDIGDGSVASADIADAGVEAADIAPGAVRSSHIADGSVQNQHLGLASVNSATLANNAVDSSSILDGSVGGVDIASGTIGREHLANGAVAAGKIGADAVGTIELLDGSVASADIADAGIGAADIAPGAVGTATLQVGAVFTPQIADNAVTSAKVAANTVSGGHILDGAITGADIAASTIDASRLSFTPGDITAVTAQAGLTGGGTAGGVALGIDFAAVQARVTGSCLVGQYFRGIAANGSVICEPVPGVPAVTLIDDAPATDLGQYTSIAIGQEGLPVVAYFDNTAGRLLAAKCRNSACSGVSTLSVVDDPASVAGIYLDIAVRPDGRPVISYQDVTAQQLKLAVCNQSDCSGGINAVVTIATPYGFGEYSSIAIGSDGLPVIAARDTASQALRLVKCTGWPCSATIAQIDDPTNSVGHAVSVAIGSDGFPVMSYFDLTAGDLKLAKCANLDCTSVATLTLDTAGNVGDHSSIAIGSDGSPVISYHDASNAALKIAKCGNAGCGSVTLTTVDDPATLVGLYTSIAVGIDGLPVVSHHDSVAGTLRVTKCANAACTTASTVVVDDPATRVGRHTSIAIGADALPVIAYQDFDLLAPKVAKCGTRSCL